MFSLFAYFGPEASLPLVSGIMAVLGFAFMMGRNCFQLVGHRIRGVTRRLGLAGSAPVPGRTLRKISGLIPGEAPISTAPAVDREPTVGS